MTNLQPDEDVMLVATSEGSFRRRYYLYPLFRPQGGGARPLPWWKLIIDQELAGEWKHCKDTIQDSLPLMLSLIEEDWQHLVPRDLVWRDHATGEQVDIYGLKFDG